MIRPATAFRFRDRIFSSKDKEGSSLKTLFEVLGKWKDGKFELCVHLQVVYSILNSHVHLLHAHITQLFTYHQRSNR